MCLLILEEYHDAQLSERTISFVYCTVEDRKIHAKNDYVYKKFTSYRHKNVWDL